jgi:hypothetical protein
VSATVVAPLSAGPYCLVYDMLRELVTWFSWTGTSTLAVNVIVTGAPQYGVTWLTDSIPSTIPPGMSVQIPVSLQNAGTVTWQTSGPNPISLAYHWRTGACDGTSWAIWEGRRSAFPAPVPSGAIANVNATVIAPQASGLHCLMFDPVHELVTWFSWQGVPTLNRTVDITGAPPYAVAWLSDITPAALSAGTTVQVPVSVRNVGSLTWQTTGANPVLFAYHWRAGACPGTAYVTWDGARTALPAPIGTGATASLSATVVAPVAPGTYCITYDLLHRAVTWFSWQAVLTLDRTVNVTP